jgi:hypothetical protein
MDELLDRLRTAAAGLEATRPAVDAGSPWPLATTFDHSDEARWGPSEVLAHLSEMAPYWLGEIERVLADGGPDPVAFGRIATDPVRLAILERDRSLPPRELYDRIAADLGRLERRWAGLSAEEKARRGVHPSRGEMAVGEMADRFIVGHLEDHVRQLGTLLAGRGGPAG